MARKKLTYNEYVEQIREDSTLEDLWSYFLGIKVFNYTVTTPEQRKELKEKIIPKAIVDLEKEINNNVKIWHNAPIFRLAYQFCLNNPKLALKMTNEHLNYYNEYCRLHHKKTIPLLSKISNPVELTFDIAIDIVNRMTEDNNSVGIQQRFKEYYKRTVNTEIL